MTQPDPKPTMPLKDYTHAGHAGHAPTHADSNAFEPTGVEQERQTQFMLLALDLITPSLTNPRKTFDEAKMQELTASINASGVHQPVIVRPLPGSRSADTFRARLAGQPLPSFELVVGERRLRASRRAACSNIPALVRDLTDNQVLEIQIIENLQRDDLAELEEAEGYAALVAATGIDKRAIGERIGRSSSYVYARLKLLDLCHEARQALHGGGIDASRGLLIARIPDQKLQLKALKEFKERHPNGDYVISQRAAQLWIRQNVMLKLADARFNIKSAALVATAGACTDCPKRTGANPDLFSEIDSPDLCIDPACYHAKEDAHNAIITKAARAKGMTVIDGKEAQKAMPWAGSHYIDGYKDLDSTTLSPQTKKQVPLRELLTKDELKGHVQLLIDPHTNQPREVVTTSVAAKGYERLVPPSKTAKTASHKETVAETKDRLQAKYEQAWRTQAEAAIAPKIATSLHPFEPFEPALLRAILFCLATNSEGDTQWMADTLQLADKRDIWEDDKVRAAVATIPEFDLGARIAAALLHEETKQDPALPTPVIDSLAKAGSVDVAAIKAEVQADMLEAAKPKDAKPKATAPEGAGREAGPMGDTFGVGDEVRFKQDLKGPGGKLRKVCGRVGSIEQRQGDRGWMVRYGKGKNDVTVADWTELVHA